MIKFMIKLMIWGRLADRESVAWISKNVGLLMHTFRSVDGFLPLDYDYSLFPLTLPIKKVE